MVMIHGSLVIIETHNDGTQRFKKRLVDSKAKQKYAFVIAHIIQLTYHTIPYHY